jgi:hypothetical protein
VSRGDRGIIGRGTRLVLISPRVPEAVARIRRLIDQESKKAARREYEKEFGMPVTHRSIGAELTRLIEDAFAFGREPTLPWHIALALRLDDRRSGRKVGRPRTVVWASKRERKLAKARQLMEQGHTARQAAEIIEPGSVKAADQIVSGLSHKRPRKPS